MAAEGAYFGIGLILLLIVIYLAMLRLKVKEIVAEVEGSRRTVEELFTIKTKKIIQLKAILEPHATKKMKDLFRNLDKALNDFIKSTTEEKIIKSEDINSIVKQIIDEAKNDKHLVLDEYFHTASGELEAINTRLSYAKRNYLKDIDQYEKMKKKFPFSIFPWPKWDKYSESKMIIMRKKPTEEIPQKEELEETNKEAEITKKEREETHILDEDEEKALKKIKEKKQGKKAKIKKKKSEYSKKSKKAKKK